MKSPLRHRPRILFVCFGPFFLGHTISQVSASRLTTHRNDAAAFTIVPQIFVVICVPTVILIPTGSTVVFYLNQETLSFSKLSLARYVHCHWKITKLLWAYNFWGQANIPSKRNKIVLLLFSSIIKRSNPIEGTSACTKKDMHKKSDSVPYLMLQLRGHCFLRKTIVDI